MNKCEKIQIKILENKLILSKEELKHIENCPDCKEIKEYIPMLNSIQSTNVFDKEPSSLLDNKIKAYAKDKTQAAKERFKVDFIYKFILPIATAATITIVFSNLHIIHKAKTQEYIAMTSNISNDSYDINQGLLELDNCQTTNSVESSVDIDNRDEINEIMTLESDEYATNSDLFSDIAEKLNQNNF